ncbi:aldo/keto reductase [Streptomyces rimosus]|uniref:aldo/keto reductase n=1 Tax=Streptomyces rimosus TaxID=1927 RepID=UPI00067D0E0D|nr:aldo/keto reductase [Streptomyces rimosus]
MRHRQLGTGGPTAAAIGFGTLALVGGYGAVDEETAQATVRQALDLGVTLLDTADFYGGGEIERLVGRAVAGRREDALIATRGGAVFTGAARPTTFDCRPEQLRRACDASLRRLDVDHIDLYYLARVDPAVPVEDSVGGLAELVAAGKVRWIGLSEVSAEQLRRAHRVHPVTALESEYSLWERGIEDEILPTARELGVGLVAHSPLGRGFLAGGLGSAHDLVPGDFRCRQQRFADQRLRRDRRRLAAAEGIAAAHGLSLAQLSLAWLLARGEDIVPIPGTRTAAHLAQNAAAADAVLDPDEAEQLSTVLMG